MRANERIELATLAARWEMTQGGSSSEATAYARAAADVVAFLGEKGAVDVQICRIWEALKTLGFEPDEEDNLVEALEDVYDEDYNLYLDLVDGAPGNDPAAARTYIMTRGGTR